MSEPISTDDIDSLDIGDMILYPSVAHRGQGYDIGIVYKAIYQHHYVVHWINKDGSIDNTEETLEGIRLWQNGSLLYKV